MTNWTTWALAASTFSLTACQGDPPQGRSQRSPQGSRADRREARPVHHGAFDQLASIFRSIRFGASNAHGRANASQFSFFEERGAFSRDSANDRYRVNFPKMRAAVDEMAGQILRFQGNGDYAGVTRFMAERGRLSTQLQQDLARLGSKGIPVDIVFDQGPEVLQ